ncbi:MAG: hypothetical protein Q9219_002779 [cf. Caloplaca sp. 3 TL-2023]
MEDILEADEQADNGTHAPTLTDGAPTFIYSEQDDVQVRTLAPATLVKLDALLHKAIHAGRIGDIPVDDVHRLQKLCDRAVVVVQTSDLSIDMAWNSDEFSGWIQRAYFAETALRSARTAVRIMVGFWQDKRTCSEEALHNIVDVLNKVLTSCIIPIVAIRPKEAGSELFGLASSHSKEIGQVLYQANKVMRQLVELLDKVDVAEAIVTSLEFFATRVLFVENAQSEKESVLGIQKFEGLRRTAMDILSGIFSKYIEQRAYIFDEILTSLQKLPTKGQNARQFKLSDGASIQLVSALIMRLVQTSAAPSKTVPNAPYARRSYAHEEARTESGLSDAEEEEVSEISEPANGHESSENVSDDKGKTARQRLADEANRLNGYAAKDAQYVVRYLVQRAMTASKSGDQPYRHLLDMFTDDLILVLGNPEWPAAELLLRALVVSMMSITENKSTAPAKTMALELLGTMGSAISELVANTQSCARSLESHDSQSSNYLRQLFDDYLDGSLDSTELTTWNGPYRMVMDYLTSIDSEGLPTRTAQFYYLAQWARGVTLTELSADAKKKFIVSQLRTVFSSKLWSPSE